MVQHSSPSYTVPGLTGPAAHLAGPFHGKHPECCQAAVAQHLQSPCTSWHSLVSDWLSTHPQSPFSEGPQTPPVGSWQLCEC